MPGKRRAWQNIEGVREKPKDGHTWTHMREKPKDGQTWTHMGTGKVYKYSEEKELWVWTGETLPVPFVGEFP